MILQKEDSLYIIFLPDAENNLVSIPGNTYKTQWFNPRDGLEFEDGTLHHIYGGEEVIIGLPSSDASKDWICKLIKTNPFEASIDVVKDEYIQAFDEGSADLSSFDTLTIQKSGFGEFDSTHLVISDPSLLDLELISFSDLEEVYAVKLQPEVNSLSNGEYVINIGVNSDISLSRNIIFELVVSEIDISVEEIANTSKLRLRTNIVQSHLEFEGEFPPRATAKIYDLNGSQVLTQNMEKKSNAGIDINQFEQGMYILQIESGSEISNFKFLKVN